MRAPILNQMLDNSVLHSRILQLYLCILHLRIWQCCNCICAFCIVAIVFAHCSSTWIILILIVAVLTRIVLQLKSFFSKATVIVEGHVGPLSSRCVIVRHCHNSYLWICSFLHIFAFFFFFFTFRFNKDKTTKSMMQINLSKLFSFKGYIFLSQATAPMCPSMWNLL